tara:strand:- start:2044 stop:2307 length:264 start_codon:yes stop_codon:yes gene_type:complete
MPRNRKKKDVLVNYKDNGTIDVELSLSNMSPKRGRGYRSVLYFDGKIKGAGIEGYVKLWRPVTKTRRKEILRQFHKNMIADNSPKII